MPINTFSRSSCTLVPNGPLCCWNISAPPPAFLTLSLTIRKDIISDEWWKPLPLFWLNSHRLSAHYFKLETPSADLHSEFSYLSSGRVLLGGDVLIKPYFCDGYSLIIRGLLYHCTLCFKYPFFTVLLGFDPLLCAVAGRQM